MGRWGSGAVKLKGAVGSWLGKVELSIGWMEKLSGMNVVIEFVMDDVDRLEGGTDGGFVRCITKGRREEIVDVVMDELEVE